MANLLELAGYVQKQGDLGRQRGEQSRLASLASQAYTAPRADRQGLLGQMAQTSPDAAVAQQKLFRQGDSDRMADLSRKAKVFVGMAESGNAQAVASLYPQIAQEARELGLGDIPMEYNDTFLPGLKKFASILDDGQASEVGVQSTYVDSQGNRVAILRDGSTRTLGQNAPNNQIIDTGNGFYGVNKSSLSAAPVMVGGQPQQAPQGVPSATFVAEDGSLIPTQQFSASDGSAARFDSGVPQYVRDQILAQPTSFGGAPDRSTAMLPPTNRSPQQFGGGQQLRSAPKEGAAPAGYRRTADGNLEFIPGGPADPFLKNERTSPTAAKPIPVGALNQVLGAQDALGATRVISDIVSKHTSRIQDGSLVIGPVDTIGAKLRTTLGRSTPQDVNLNEWEADKTKIVNESLRLNKGVQTEGDAQRAVQELMGASDQQTAIRALKRLTELNKRAVELQQEKLRTIYRNYNRGPDGEQIQAAPQGNDRRRALLDKY